MEICIRKEPNGQIYIDKKVLNRINKQTLSQPPYNFSFVEIEKDDCEIGDFNNDLTFNIKKYNQRKQTPILQKELIELQSWFEEYDNQVKQYIRCERLGVEFDKDINELDLQAQTNAKRIKEIRAILGGAQ